MQCCLVPSQLDEIACASGLRRKLVQQGPRDWWGFRGVAEPGGDAEQAPEDLSDRVAGKSALESARAINKRE